MATPLPGMWKILLLQSHLPLFRLRRKPGRRWRFDDDKEEHLLEAA